MSMHRSKVFRDRRWEAEFSLGNSRVDYAEDVEERDHMMGQTLRDIGYGDVVI